ncbi:MAG: dienelactone hydrolase family protein [Clostridia bacterium]|nr:dienelactone hydrolase family protein [Clostridia bacterium]
MKVNAALESHLNIISKIIRKRNAEVFEVLALNDSHAITNRIKRLKNLYFSMLDTDMYKIPSKVIKVGEIICKGYNIEKLVMESLEGYFVPMNLYVPTCNLYMRSGCKPVKKPAILVNIGHYIEGKALPENQIMCANLALLGFMVLTLDPICQGERDMFPERTQEHRKKDMWVVEQHMKVGNQCYLLGDNSVNYFINDAIKAVDYLTSRSDVDTNRIGVTGQSGGGTLSYLLASADDRIKAVAPVHCLSTMDRICANSIGDSEQSMIDMLYNGFDTADFLWLVAPKPLFIIAGKRDFFSIDGVQEIYQELKKVYGILGHYKNVEKCEIDVGHVISQEVRESIYRFFSEIFMGKTQLCGEAFTLSEEDMLQKSMHLKTLCNRENTVNYIEAIVPVFPPEHLNCGINELKSKTPLDYNLAKLIRLKALQQIGNKSIKEIRETIKKKLETYRSEYELIKDTTCSKNNLRKLGFRDLDSLSFEIEMDILAGRQNTIVYIDLEDQIKLLDIDKNTISKSDIKTTYRDNEKYVKGEERSNRIVIRPFGSRRNSCKCGTEYDDETRLAYQGIVSGKIIFGIRLKEILFALDYIKYKMQIDTDSKLEIHGRGQGALLGVFTGMINDNVSKIYCEDLIKSFSILFGKNDYSLNETDIIPGILKEFDIDTLMSCLGDRIDVINYIQ